MVDLAADLDVRLRVPLYKLLAERPGISVFSGRRSYAKQAELFAAAVVKYGSEQAAARWVARPGTSRHNLGLAADLAFASPADKTWAHANAARFGLHFPMTWEDWHIEPINLNGPAPVDPEAQDMTPQQAAQLDRIEQKLDALVAPRRPDHVDPDPGHTSLGDVLTAEEKQPGA